MPVYGCSGELSVGAQDVHAVLDQFGLWNKDESHPLAGRLDLGRIGMSGHSFGAVTTQAVSGWVFPIGKGFTDPRINVAVLMSPSAPRAGGDPKKAFGEVKIPWMVLTGTDGTRRSGNLPRSPVSNGLPGAAAAGKDELVLDKAEHSAFTDRELPGEAHKHNPNHHRAILAVTTAFWDAYLRDDARPGSGSTGKRYEACWRRTTGGRGSDRPLQPSRRRWRDLATQATGSARRIVVPALHGSPRQTAPPPNASRSGLIM